MPIPPLDVQRDFSQLREELQLNLQRLETRLQRLESRNGLEAHDVAALHSPGQDGNEMVEMSLEDDKVTQPDLRAVELKTGGAIPTQTMQSVDAEQQEGRVHFGESAWTFPFVIGLIPAGRWDVTFSILLLLLNLGMQAAFTIIISTDDFMGIPFGHQTNFAKRWRISIAHDYQFLDLAGRSLVSRVCAGDGALILSNTQANLVEQINSFLGLQKDQFEVPFFQPGSLLCMLCISMILFTFIQPHLNEFGMMFMWLMFFRGMGGTSQVSSFGAFASTRSAAVFGSDWRLCGGSPAPTSQYSATMPCAV